MELDTGATRPSMSLVHYVESVQQRQSNQLIFKCVAILVRFFILFKPALSKVNVHIQHGGVKSNQNLYIFEKDVATVRGRQWLRELNVNTFKLHTLRTITADGGKLLEKIFKDQILLEPSQNSKYP
jgi:hypothetical protein